MLTLDANASAEIEVKRSKFIAHVVPMSGFEVFVTECRRTHSRASHHCTAARWIGASFRVEELAHDDGEPGGTAGRPMLRVLQGGDWINVGAVVVRYFGGTKLGTGGLARAYAKAVRSALYTTTPTVHVVEQSTCLEVAFEQLDALERACAANACTVIARDYHDRGARVTVRGPEPGLAVLRKALI